MTMLELGEGLKNSLLQGATVTCSSVQEGVLWSGVIEVVLQDGSASCYKSPAVYVSSDIACGGVQFLVDTIQKSLVPKIGVKSSWERHQEPKDARLSA